MAYDKYAEGNKPYTAASGNVVLAADVNEANEQLAAMLGPLDRQLPMAGMGTAGSGWGNTTVPDPPAWLEGNQAGVVLLIELPVKEGEKVKSFTLLLGGTAAGTETAEGSIIVRRVQMADSATKATVVTLDDTDPWQLGGVGPLVQTYDVADFVIAAGYYYYLEFISVGDGAADCIYYGGTAEVQSGN